MRRRARNCSQRNQSRQLRPRSDAARCAWRCGAAAFSAKPISSSSASARSSRRTSPRTSSRSSRPRRASRRISTSRCSRARTASCAPCTAGIAPRTTPSASHLIRHLLPDAAIGADVIVGFPGETDADFETTAEFIAALPFTYLHVFSFSERPGTAAANLDGTRSRAGDPRTRPRVACARRAKSRRLPGVTIRPRAARPHARPRR